MLSRRTFLAGTAAAVLGTRAPKIRAAESSMKRIAFLGTEVRLHSHAQHFLDRLTLGYAWPFDVRLLSRLLAEHLSPFLADDTAISR